MSWETAKRSGFFSRTIESWEIECEIAFCILGLTRRSFLAARASYSDRSWERLIARTVAATVSLISVLVGSFDLAIML